jgi:hypothetical protein
MNARAATKTSQAKKASKLASKTAIEAKGESDSSEPSAGVAGPKRRGRRPMQAAAADAKLPQRGAALARALEARAQSLGLSQKAAAHQIGFSEPYYALLLGGQRWFGSVEEASLKRIAEFLDVPIISVLLMAEKVYPQDFFRSTTIESQIDFVFATMSKDKRWTSAMPNHIDWSKTPQSVRLLAALLYQECSGKDLMEKARLLRIEDPSGAA